MSRIGPKDPVQQIGRLDEGKATRHPDKTNP